MSASEGPGLQHHCFQPHFIAIIGLSCYNINITGMHKNKRRKEECYGNPYFTQRLLERNHGRRGQCRRDERTSGLYGSGGGGRSSGGGAGGGIPGIVNVWRDRGWGEPAIRPDPGTGSVTLTLPLGAQRARGSFRQDAERTAAMFDLLLGDDLAGRKNHIAENGSRFLDLADIS